jgi:hypothetical protein
LPSVLSAVARRAKAEARGAKEGEWGFGQEKEGEIRVYE